MAAPDTDATYEAFAADEDRLNFFRVALGGFSRAEHSMGGATDLFYNIGGLTVRLRFAGPALITQLAPALAHLQTNVSADPALTICLWDSASTGSKMPLLVNSLIQLMRLRWWEQLDGRREIKDYSAGRIRSTFHLGPDILSVFDTQQNLAVYWIESAEQIPYYERGYPLQAILNMWAAQRQRFFVHAAAVGTDDGGVLLAGPSGSGKSTTTLSCLNANLKVAADDYTLIAPGATPQGYSLYNTIKLRTLEDLSKFPAYLPDISNNERLNDEKPMIFLHEHYPRQTLLNFPIKALLLPRVSGGANTSLHPVSANAALMALAPSTLLQLPGNGQDNFRVMSGLVRQTPCFTLALGTDLAQIPVVISNLLGAVA